MDNVFATPGNLPGQSKHREFPILIYCCLLLLPPVSPSRFHRFPLIFVPNAQKFIPESPPMHNTMIGLQTNNSPINAPFADERDDVFTGRQDGAMPRTALPVGQPTQALLSRQRARNMKCQRLLKRNLNLIWVIINEY